jgi:hypothetical protein
MYEGDAVKTVAKLVIGFAFFFVATNANALTVSYHAGSGATDTITSTPGATTFWDFDGTANTSIGTVTGGFVGPTPAAPTGFGSNPVPTNSSNHWDSAFGSGGSITVDLTNPASYVGFTWGTPDADNEVEVFNGTTLLNTYTGASLNITQFHDTPGTGFFNIFADSGEAITSLVLTSDVTGETLPNNFEVDNFAAIEPSAATPLPAALPLFATGIGGLGLLGWRRKRKAQAVA